MKCKECGTELLEGDCICGTCGAEVNTSFQNPVNNFVSPASDEPTYQSVYPTYEEAELLRRQRGTEAPDISSNGVSKSINNPLFRILGKITIVISVVLTLYCFYQNCFNVDIHFNGLRPDLYSVDNIKVKQLTYNIFLRIFVLHPGKIMLASSIITILILFIKNFQKWVSKAIILQLICTFGCIGSALKIYYNTKLSLPYMNKIYNLEQSGVNIKLGMGIGFKLLILIAVLLSFSLIMLRHNTKSYKSGT